jgi:hypothetical protein
MQYKEAIIGPNAALLGRRRRRQSAYGNVHSLYKDARKSDRFKR